MAGERICGGGKKCGVVCGASDNSSGTRGAVNLATVVDFGDFDCSDSNSIIRL